MIYYKDTNNKLFAFRDDTKKNVIYKVEKTHKTLLTKITYTEYQSIKYFGDSSKTKDQIEEKIKRIKLEEKINFLKKESNSLINNKRQKLKDYIVGFKIDEKQEEAYELKYQVAKRYLDTTTNEDKAKLQSEANLRGLSVDDLAKLVVKKHNEWVSELEVFSQKIELFRIAFNKLLENEKYEKAKEVLENAKELNINSTDEDVLNLFK